MSECLEPCTPSDPCEDCGPYWERMVNEGFWDPIKQEWTDSGVRQMCK